MPLTHRLSRTYTYKSWKEMRKRCLNKNHKSYPDYGGAGIGICKRWDNYLNFLADMGERPHGCVIDRINNKKGYSPANCRWATPLESSRNRSHLKKYTFNGVTKYRWQWVLEAKISDQLIRTRLWKGWTFEDALMRPLYARR